MLCLLAIVLVGLGAVHAEDHWAVLVAGSNGFANYRHQADVCHAYHVLMSRGFHPDRVITMLYDDVAHSKENPFPGKLYNFPWKTLDDAVDVYKGCKVDYKGKLVTPDIFLAVLTGDAAAAGGKVLRSKKDDHVFVNFVDHGAVGLIAFPEGVKVLHANQLVSTLTAMHGKGMYKQLTFYLETCESGSMFENLLPTSLPVYALTAANAKESSWGTFCGEESSVAGKNIGSCLGDLFSVNWMMDSDNGTEERETLAQQFHRVKAMTQKSHVMRYGQWKAFGKELVNDFIGPVGSLAKTTPAVVVQGAQKVAHASAVASRDIKLELLYRTYLREGTAAAGDKLIEEIKGRQAVQALGASMEASIPASRPPPVAAPAAPAGSPTWTTERAACHEQAAEAFGATCGWSEGRLTLSKVLYELCYRVGDDAAPVLVAINKACVPAAADIWS